MGSLAYVEGSEPVGAMPSVPPTPPPLRVTANVTFVLPQDGVDLEKLEKSLLQQALERTAWNRTRTGKLLRLSRDQVRYRIEKYGLVEC